MARTVFLIVAATGATPAQTLAVAVDGLRCEYLVNPAGLDTIAPRLSWWMQSEERGQKQTAYQVLAASSAQRLTQDQGDLWDSGQVKTNQTIHVVYTGRPLSSRQRVFWKVRVWDKDDQVSAWSAPAVWSMGLLNSSDWRAKWIADPQSATRPHTRGPHNGYHSELAKSSQAAKWVALDMGQTRLIDAVRLFPARPYDWQPDTPGFLFPLRFKIEVAEKPDFSDGRVVVDRMREDEPNPGTNAPTYVFQPTSARYARLAVNALRLRDAGNFAFALAEAQVLGAGRNWAAGAKVTAQDSIETGAWAKTNLVDGLQTTIPPDGGPVALPASMFRKSFEVDGKIQRATVYVTALGLYELRINGRRVGDRILTPEWTNYRKRIQYQTFDVTGWLRTGKNAVGAMVGEGWYAGRLMVFGRNAYGSYPRFLMQMEIELEGGGVQTVSTDGSWLSTTDGPIRSASIYDGECYDARKETPGWDAPAFDDKAWRPVLMFEPDAVHLVGQPNEPIRVAEELLPVKMTEPKTGVYIFDFGQNMVGWCRLQLQGPAGKIVTLRHGEMLNPDGTLYTANLRGAAQTDQYILRGEGRETFEPHFTYHGFRFVEVTGLAPASNAIIGRVFYSSAPDASQFESSSTLVNQLMRNVYWTQRGNLMSTPNDCPQRDERFGWMGDIQAFAQTAIFNMDMAAFFTKWVKDIRDDQADDGRYPDFAPHPGDPNASFSGVPAWGDAGTVVPWRVYQNYADTRLLEEHFASAKRWVEYVRKFNPDLIWSKGRNNDYNDWLNGDTLVHPDWPRTGGAVPQEVFATAFFAHSTEIVAKMAMVLGKTEEAAVYRGLFEHIKAAFNQRFVTPDGRIQGNTQAGYALALHFDLLPARLCAPALQWMIDGFKRYKGHLSTGIQTSHRLMLELSRHGYMDEAYRLLNLRDFPAWGMMVENGATTIWERWDGYVKNRGFQDPGMNSFNHWAFGAIGEWIWRNLAGINPDEAAPGYGHFLIAPKPGGGITWTKARYDSIRGRILSEWKVENNLITLQVRIPPNTEATVRLPARDKESITESGMAVSQAAGVTFIGRENGCAVLRLAPGSYAFHAPLK